MLRSAAAPQLHFFNLSFPVKNAEHAHVGKTALGKGLINS